MTNGQYPPDITLQQHVAHKGMQFLGNMINLISFGWLTNSMQLTLIDLQILHIFKSQFKEKLNIGIL